MTTALILANADGSFRVVHYVHNHNVTTYIRDFEYESMAIAFCKTNEWFRNWHRV